MLTHEEVKKIAYTKLLEMKGRQYLLDNREKFYTSCGNKGEICDMAILLSNIDTDSLFDADGNIVVDETKKADEEFKFEINIRTGECKYIP